MRCAHCSIRGNGEVISRQDFMERHERLQAARLARLNKKPKRLASQGKDVTGCPLLQVRPGSQSRDHIQAVAGPTSVVKTWPL
jgi:hypothetical protein